MGEKKPYCEHQVRQNGYNGGNNNNDLSQFMKILREDQAKVCNKEQLDCGPGKGKNDNKADHDIHYHDNGFGHSARHWACSQADYDRDNYKDV